MHNTDVFMQMESVVHLADDLYWLLESACQSVLGYEPEPQIAPKGTAIIT